MELSKLKNIFPIKNDRTGQVVAAKINVYDTLPDPYYTFISGEAYQAIEEYLAFRSAHGEVISGETWVLRDKFLTTADDKGGSTAGGSSSSLATHPKKLSVSGVKQILSRALRAQNIRQRPLAKGERRYEWKTSHGLRKYFKSNAERVMRPLNVAMLMDHKSGVSDSYWRPTEQDLLEDYVKAVDYLTINKESKVISELQNDVMEKLVLREKESEFLREQMKEVRASHQQQQQQQEALQKQINVLFQALQSSNAINVAVSNWWAQYNNVPFELRPKFRETMKLAREKPDLFVKLFASDDVVNRTTESQNILQVMKERLASLENNK